MHREIVHGANRFDREMAAKRFVHKRFSSEENISKNNRLRGKI